VGRRRGGRGAARRGHGHVHRRGRLGGGHGGDLRGAVDHEGVRRYAAELHVRRARQVGARDDDHRAAGRAAATGGKRRQRGRRRGGVGEVVGADGAGGARRRGHRDVHRAGAAGRRHRLQGRVGQHGEAGGVGAAELNVGGAGEAAAQHGDGLAARRAAGGDRQPRDAGRRGRGVGEADGRGGAPRRGHRHIHHAGGLGRRRGGDPGVRLDGEAGVHRPEADGGGPREARAGEVDDHAAGRAVRRQAQAGQRGGAGGGVGELVRPRHPRRAAGRFDANVNRTSRLRQADRRDLRRGIDRERGRFHRAEPDIGRRREVGTSADHTGAARAAVGRRAQVKTPVVWAGEVAVVDVEELTVKLTEPPPNRTAVAE